jgi:AcrR family transcriptional regulator
VGTFELPAGLAAAWTEHGQPGRPARTGLSRARIVEAAIELADAEGLGALSMGKLAERLGFTPMSLYRHVRSKEELVLLMQDAAVGPPPADAAGSSWRADLEQWTWQVLGRMRAHPWILQTIPMFGPPATPHQVAWLERGLQALAPTPLTESEKLTTILLVDAHVFSDLQFAAFGSPTAAGAADPADYGAVLAGVLDPERFPAVLRAVEAGAFGSGPDPDARRDADFAFGLARILDGVEQLVHSRAGG